MKHPVIIALLLAFILLVPPACAEQPDYTDDTRYSNFAGRLYIPDVGIDVALYRSNAQGVVDRKDSAAYFDLATHPKHMIVADHWTQGFATLKDVEVGMEAYIVHKDGVTTYYNCVEVLDGHNTGHIITDSRYREVVSRSDLLMYTCIDGWRNVRVCLFDVVVMVWDEEEQEEGGGINGSHHIGHHDRKPVLSEGRTHHPARDRAAQHRCGQHRFAPVRPA